MIKYTHSPLSVSSLLWNVGTRDNHLHFLSGVRDSDGTLKKLKSAAYAEHDG